MGKVKLRIVDPYFKNHPLRINGVILKDGDNSFSPKEIAAIDRAGGFPPSVEVISIQQEAKPERLPQKSAS